MSVATRNPATYVITTSPASLAAAFRTLTADVSLGAASKSAVSAPTFTPSGPGISVRQAPRAGFSTTLGLSFDFSDSSGGLTYSLQGEADFTPSVDFEASLLQGWAGIPDGAAMSFAARLGVTESHTFTASGMLQHQWPVGPGPGFYPPAAFHDPPELTPQAGKYCYGTFLIQLGPLPLILTPCVEVNVSLSVTGTVGVTASVDFSYGEEASWTSANPGTLTLTDLSQTPAAGSPPDTSTLPQAKGSLGLDVKPELFLYGVTGPFIDASITLLVTVAPASRPWLTLDLQLSVSAGWEITIDFLGIDVQVQAGATLSWRLYDSTGPPRQPPPLTISPPSATVNPGASQQFTAPAAAGTVTWSLLDQARDQITSAGLFTAATPPGRDVTVLATDSAGAPGSAVVTIGAGTGPPRNLTAKVSPDGTTATLTWDPPVPVTGQAIASYTVSTSPPTVVTTVPGTATSTIISGLLPGASYNASVSASTSSGFDSQPATVAVAALPQPRPPGTVTVNGPAAELDVTHPGRQPELRFPGQVGEQVTAVIDNVQTSDDGCYNIYLGDPAGNLVGPAGTCGNGTSAGLGPYTLTSTGTWAVLLRADVTVTATSQLSVSAPPSASRRLPIRPQLQRTPAQR